MPLIIAFVIVICCGCNENRRMHFENLAAANQEHMIEKGWIPTFISPDARDIDLEGDLDSASVYGSYQSSDTTSLRLHCSSAEDSLRVPGYGPKWFTDDVLEAKTAGKLKGKGDEVLRCEDGFKVVVVSSRHFVSYWSTRNCASRVQKGSCRSAFHKRHTQAA